MSVIDRFVADTYGGMSLLTKQNVLSLVCFILLDQIPKIKIFHMVAIENPAGIEGRRQFIYMNVLEPEEADEDGSIDDGGASSVEDDDSGLGEAGVITSVTEVGTKEVEEVQQSVKYSSFLYYMLKPPSLITHGHA